MDGLRLYTKSLVLKFRLDFTLLVNSDARIKLKCVARVNGVEREVRESVVTIFIPSMDQLNNQKLINWKSSGKSIKILKDLRTVPGPKNNK